MNKMNKHINVILNELCCLLETLTRICKTEGTVVCRVLIKQKVDVFLIK